ncbi:putative transposase [Pseudactinotalea sp. HY158]|uniref:putative transposase n=1 Tax=Pseudactinotalea sp. HY158 TaxID=2654547 RepID=UPI00129C3574|nr:hypothetical protein [Pseudactinotalea sp. HY158]QGH68393.1 hypothetical protein GCE65_01880 [Pseudactinotalea sp. HY158]
MGGRGGAGRGGARVEAVPVVLAEPEPRVGERAAARAHVIEAADPVFAPAARVPLAGLLLALPALAATGLLSCAREVYGKLPAGFYGLETMLLEGVLRALAGQPRAEGAGRFAPVDLGRVLGMDRAPEVKTIRRKIGQLTARAGPVTCSRAWPPTTSAGPALPAGTKTSVWCCMSTGTSGRIRARRRSPRRTCPGCVPRPRDGGDLDQRCRRRPGAGGDVRARRLARDGAAVPAAAAEEGGRGRPAGPGRLRPRRLVPALFAHMAARGFDVLTWRKGHTENVAGDLFAETVSIDETGREHHWILADTIVELPIKNGGGTYPMRQVTRLDTKKGLTKQVHVLTTRTDLPAVRDHVPDGSRWRQETTSATPAATWAWTLTTPMPRARTTRTGQYRTRPNAIPPGRAERHGQGRARTRPHRRRPPGSPHDHPGQAGVGRNEHPP